MIDPYQAITDRIIEQLDWGVVRALHAESGAAALERLLVNSNGTSRTMVEPA